MNDLALQGFKPIVESALSTVIRRAAGAALERCRHPVTGRIKLQPAMQLLTGNPALKGKGPERLFNEIYGRPRSLAVSIDDLESAVRDAAQLGDDEAEQDFGMRLVTGDISAKL
jgi:hypothetical protein